MILALAVFGQETFNRDRSKSTNSLWAENISPSHINSSLGKTLVISTIFRWINVLTTGNVSANPITGRPRSGYENEQSKTSGSSSKLIHKICKNVQKKHSSGDQIAASQRRQGSLFELRVQKKE